MNIEFLISTMNRVDDLFVKKIFQNLKSDVNYVVINQCVDVDVSHAVKFVPHFVNVTDKGLAKSRNLALQNSSGDVIVFTDDDVVFPSDVLEVIESSFKENKDVDIFTFQVKTPEDNYFKCYDNFEFDHSFLSLLHVSSAEIAIKSESIIDNQIFFDERFGLGAEFPSAEENIFLTDCYKKRLKLKYIPKVLSIHPMESSGSNINERIIIGKGAAFYRIFSFLYPFALMVFMFRQRKRYKNYFSSAIYFKLLVNGVQRIKNNG